MLQAQELFTHGDKNFAGTAIYSHWPEKVSYHVICLSFAQLNGSDFEAPLKEALITAFMEAGFAKALSVNRDLPLVGFFKKFDVITKEHDQVFLLDDWDAPLAQLLGNDAALTQV